MSKELHIMKETALAKLTYKDFYIFPLAYQEGFRIDPYLFLLTAFCFRDEDNGQFAIG